MVRRNVVVNAPGGLHARPAAELARLAAQLPGGVRIGLGAHDPVDAASVLSVMNLGVAQGDEVTLEAAGTDAEATLARIADLLAAEAS